MTVFISLATSNRPISANPGAALSVYPSSIIDETKTPGTSFTVRINVAAVSNLMGFEFKLAYKTAVLNATNVSLGSWFPSNSFVPKKEINDTLGYVWYAVCLPYVGGKTGSGTLAVISFTVNSLGASCLYLFDTKLADPDANPIFHEVYDGHFVNSDVHDIGLTNVVLPPPPRYFGPPRLPRVLQGETLSGIFVARNHGSFAESFNVTFYANATAVGTPVIVTDLAPGGRLEIPFIWNTTGFALGSYFIAANATTVPDEIDTADNTLSKILDFGRTPHVYVDIIIIVAKTPTAAFKYSPGEPVPGQEVNFNASDSTPDGGVIESYRWDFGDYQGADTVLSNIVHVYSSPGTYSVTLTVIDSEGLNDTTWQFITVSGPAFPPVVLFRWTPEKPRVNEQVFFEAFAYDINGWIISYEWNFGDGAYEFFSPTAYHSYTHAGNYTASVTVRDNDGLPTTVYAQITVVPRLTISIAPEMGTVGTMVTVTGSNATSNGQVDICWNMYAYDYYLPRFNYTLVGTTEANSTGQFSFTFPVPSSAMGRHFVKATDKTTESSEETTFEVLPSISLDPASGPVGTKVTIKGTGFPVPPSAGPQVAYITFDDQLFYAIATQDSNGNMQSTINVPFASPGLHVIKVLITFYQYPRQYYLVEASFTLTDTTPLGIAVDVGAIYFKGETAEFYVQTAFKGTTVNATSIDAKLNKPDGTTETLTLEQIATGLYKAKYTISGKGAMTGSYTVVAEANYNINTVNANGTSINTFLVKPTWERDAPKITAFSIASLSLVSAMIVLWQKEKKSHL